jgi:thioredoxin reductase
MSFLTYKDFPSFGEELFYIALKIKIDETGRTTVSGVYAAGDAVRTRQKVIMAASDGVNAAITINRDMVDEGIHVYVS